VLAASAERIERTLPADAEVLDVGGWGRPFNRADWVIDLMPFATRGLYGSDGTPPERFTEQTWIERDLCDRELWPFEDGRFDFAVCSHTLEDVRDPVWVCSELNRVARAGYVEVPSRLEEQSIGVHGPWAGWSHHHWLVDVGEGSIEFVFKSHAVHAHEDAHFPRGFHERLSDEERVQTLWWDGGFSYGERVMYTGDELDSYLAEFVARHAGRGARRRGLLRRAR
jgi:hypothetical protein